MIEFKLNTLIAISPIDGRYFSYVKDLPSYFSELGLIRYRVLVEVEYFIALCELPLENLRFFPRDKFQAMQDLYINFPEADAQQVKEIEKETNHDIKAIEYFLKAKFDQWGLSAYREFIHFGLTSQDINNTAVPLLFREFLGKEYLPSLFRVIHNIEMQATHWADVPMMARTHGQAATPTRLGKEMAVFAERLKKQVHLFRAIPNCGKFGGATGNFNALTIAFPSVDWNEFADNFLQNKLGLVRSYPTTQVEHYDNLAAQLDAIKRINTILIDYCRDIWHYVSIDYFKQKVRAGEVGSSAMPHKVNPIDFENAEGNLGMANAILEFMSAKLPISRLQRDLTDSTVLRNLGVPFAHSLVAYRAIEKGMLKLELNESALTNDLEQNWVVVSEAIQTILRREGFPNPYEALKKLTRGNKQVNKETIHTFIEGLDISSALKIELKHITPQNYLGIKYSL